MTLPPPVSALTSVFLDEVDERLPGRLTALLLHGSLCWDEFFPGSDVDFVAVWDEVPTGRDLELLRQAHEVTRARVASPTFDGFHATAADLAGPPDVLERRPAFFQGVFDPVGTVDINLVTWHELAERGIAVRGDVPTIHTDLPALRDFTRDNLDTYWRGLAVQVEAAGTREVGENDDAVMWLGLGAARLHHLLRTHELTSKSGGGRYVLDHLDPRWATIAQESLRLREDPASVTLYANAEQRGRDVHDLLRWLVEDGARRATA